MNVEWLHTGSDEVLKWINHEQMHKKSSIYPKAIYNIVDILQIDKIPIFKLYLVIALPVPHQQYQENYSSH